MDLDSLTLFWKRNPIFIAELYKTDLIFVVRPKKLYVFQVTWNFKIGMVGRIFFVPNFYMGIIWKQIVRMEKLHKILKNP